MRYTKAVEFAYEHAGAITSRGVEQPRPRILIPPGNDDNALVMFPSFRKKDRVPYGIYVNDHRELPDVAKEYGRIARMAMPSDEDLWDEARHEGEHGEIAHVLGGSAIYAFSMWRDRHGRNAWQMAIEVHSLRIARIGAALIYAYPRNPSDDDQATIRAIGYKDKDEVSVRAQAAGLPKPLWAR